MSKFPRPAIVTIAAIAGAQLTSLVLSPPQPGQSSSCLQWASEAVGTAYQAIRPTPPEHISYGYYDVRLHHDVEVDGQSQAQSAALAPSAPTRSAVAPAPATAYDPTIGSPTRDADRAIDQQIAASQGETLSQYYASLGTDTTLKTSYSCGWYKGKKYCGEGVK